MISIRKYNPNARSLDGLRNVSQIQTFAWYAFILLITGYMAFKMFNATYLLISVDGIVWDYSKLAWLLYILGIGVIILQPRYGVYMTVALALAGDYSITHWFPFELNFSSKQSLLYYSDSVKLSPLETYLVFTIISYLMRLLLSSKWKLSEKVYFGPLFLPAVGFTGFIAFGLLYGVGTGGDTTIALWESRPIFYLLPIMVLASNLLEERSHVKTFVWWIVIGLGFEGIMGVWAVHNWHRWQFSSFDGLGAHALSIHFNAVFVLVVGLYLYKSSWVSRLAILLLMPCMALTFIAGQRRAAFLTLGIALAISSIILFKHNRKLFLFLAPTAALFGALYTLAFWNSGSSLAMPAQAVKSVVSSSANEVDRSSNEYRDIENANTHFTIRAKPFTGVGFGQKFFIPYPLPDISFFEWWEYITHNSVIWIWMKSGIGGFYFMCLLVSYSLMLGGRLIWRMPNAEVSAFVVAMVLYIFMHFMFAYVDISWDGQSMLFIGGAMGVINAMERIMNRPIKVDEKRWPWLSEPDAIPQLETDPEPSEESTPKLPRKRIAMPA